MQRPADLRLQQPPCCLGRAAITCSGSGACADWERGQMAGSAGSAEAMQHSQWESSMQALLRQHRMQITQSLGL